MTEKEKEEQRTRELLFQYADKKSKEYSGPDYASRVKDIKSSGKINKDKPKTKTNNMSQLKTSGDKSKASLINAPAKESTATSIMKKAVNSKPKTSESEYSDFTKAERKEQNSSNRKEGKGEKRSLMNSRKPASRPNVQSKRDQFKGSMSYADRVKKSEELDREKRRG